MTDNYTCSLFITHTGFRWNTDDFDPLMGRSKTARDRTATKSQPAMFYSNNVFGVPARLV